MSWKDKLKTLSKKAQKAVKGPGQKKIVKEYYVITYTDSRGRKRSVKAKTYDEAVRKAEQLAEKGRKNIQITTGRSEVVVKVPTKKIIKEGLKKAVSAAGGQGAKKRNTRKKSKKKQSRPRRKKNELPDLW